MIAEASPLIATILCGHQVEGTSLMDSASRLATFVDNTGEGSKNAVPLRSCFFALSDDEWASLEEAACQSNNIGALNVLATLDIIRHDMRVLLRRGITHLSQWEEATQEDKAKEVVEKKSKCQDNSDDDCISSITTDILWGAVAAHCVPIIAKARWGGEAGETVEVGELRSYAKVAMPIARLFMTAMESQSVSPLKLQCGDEKGTASLQPDILVKCGDCYCLCGVVCCDREPADDEEVDYSQEDVLEEAWEKAVVSSMALTPQTSSSTVVMAVRDAYIRIGLLTLRDEVEYLSDELQGALRGAGAQVMVETDDRTLGSLKLVNRVEFGALESNALLQYFLFVTKKMCEALHHSLSISSVPGATSTVECKDITDDFRPPGCPSTFMVRAAYAVPKAPWQNRRGTHQVDSSKTHCWGLFYTQYMSELEHRAYACFAYNALPNMHHGGVYELAVEKVVPGDAFPYSWDTFYVFPAVCAAIIHLHDTLHVCHGNIERDSVIAPHRTDEVTLIGYKYSMDDMNSEPNESLPSVQALNKFLASMDALHRQYVEADHWLFHRLADVLALFQRVLFNGDQAGSAQAGPSSNGAESTGGRVDAKADSDEEDYREVENVILHIFEDRIIASSSPLLPTEQLILAILKKCEQHSTLKRLFAGTGAAVQKRLKIIRERHESSVNV